MILTLVTIGAATVALPAFIFGLECLLGVRPIAKSPGSQAPTFALIVPAHDEGSGISETVRGLLAQLREMDRLIVVADNCMDDTAELARLAGATVVERCEPERRGKGYALEFGRNALASAPPSVVIVMDADCWAEEGHLHHIAAEVHRSSSVVQAQYLFEPGHSHSPLVQISNFAVLVKNRIRQRGLARLGAPAILQGTGMGFTWQAFCDARLDTGAIAEDIEIGLDLLRKGHRISWCEQAMVWSRPAAKGATLTQRTRWEHGFISSVTGGVPRMIWAAFAQRRLSLLTLALDLTVPPLAMLITILTFCLHATLALMLVAQIIAPFMIIASALAVLVFGTLVAWAAEGRRILSLSALLKAPGYVLWKLPIYARLLVARERDWVRTTRDE